ncbi:MAG: hypothetical protein ACI9CF_000854 [Candidatus Omnitrophota bacterium]|jgi:hypothetical protein
MNADKTQFRKNFDQNEDDVIEALLTAHESSSGNADGEYAPADQRIQTFLNTFLAPCLGDVACPTLPRTTLIMDKPGLARQLSLPAHSDAYDSEILQSRRTEQGVIHNPVNDRRTTQGVFHIAEGGFLVPNDKVEVPRKTYALLLKKAFEAPESYLDLPYRSQLPKKPLHSMTSLYLRPRVSPQVNADMPYKSNEIRFFAPASLVSNLDFVETIFGNAGNPHDAKNDAGLDFEHWTGHTGCVVLAPHLTTCTKKELGLPHYNDATERQKRDGVCWQAEDELYNNGQAFKITCRGPEGVMVTLIADNYFGYCKKEVKTQISFSANLYGLCEEEHAGGAIAYASYNLGSMTHPDNALDWNKQNYAEMLTLLGDAVEPQVEGYAIDKKYPNIFYVPEDARFSLKTQKIVWTSKDVKHSIKLLPKHIYFLPSGYKIQMKKMSAEYEWKLMGTVAAGNYCHKPCTVSGGGKSEISKSIVDAIIPGSIFISNFKKDMDAIEDILKYDYSSRFREELKQAPDNRLIITSERSLGSVIKLFTPSADYADTYNQWLDTIPHHIKILIYTLKRHCKEEWGDQWRDHFSVDTINDFPGHELKKDGKILIAHYARIGHQEDGSWRLFKLRSDFFPALKIQKEDDITVSTVLPSSLFTHLNSDCSNPSIKLAENCEDFLFQRPDDAIIRGYDYQTELDQSGENVFLSNYEPLDYNQVKEIFEDTIKYEEYTKAIQKLIKRFMQHPKADYLALPSHPRLVDGKPTKNPRYLQKRPDHVNHCDAYVAKQGERLWRKVPSRDTVQLPVNAVISGRRCNPPDVKQGVPALAVYNPLHYQELPELFMDYIASVTGKSPSTTGFGSEGALTKGPFNAMAATADLNNALLSFILTDYNGFSSAAGYIGPHVKVDHDISLLVPEIWCRMRVYEQNAEYLIENGYLEKLSDFDHGGEKVLASRLGYRITRSFTQIFLGRIFNYPHKVFSDEMLKPELQDFELYVQGIQNLNKTQKEAAKHYFDDGSIEAACPPIKALLHIMVDGNYEGNGIESLEVRKLFTRDYVLNSDWYAQRLAIKQEREIKLWQKNEAYLKKCRVSQNLLKLAAQIKYLQSPTYLQNLRGTIGADPLI